MRKAAPSWASLLLSLSAAAGAAAGEGKPPDTQMDTVVVEADKLAVETRIDRKVYTVTEDALSTFGSLSDILAVIPSIDIDPDGVLSLRGDSNVLILIDGKPSTQFQGSKAGDNLQSIAAKDIERIEVLTTPPPQYKADGAAGVINIITRKHSAAGAAGTVQGSLGADKRSVVGANVTYGASRGSASLTAGYREDYRPRTVRSTTVGEDPVSGSVLTSHDHFDLRIHRNIPSAALSGEYRPNDEQTLSAAASWTRRGGLRTYAQFDDSIQPAGTVSSYRERLSSGHDPENDYDTTLRFTQKLPAAGQTLDLSLHRSVSHQFEHYDYVNYSFVPPGPVFDNNLGFHEDRGISEAGAEYTLALHGSASLKLGYAFEQDDFGFANLGASVDPVTGIETPDPTLSNDYTFTQRIQALYQSYQASFGPWALLGGVREEFTSTQARLLTNDFRIPGRYDKLYPSLHVDRTLSNQATLSVGLSSRVQRPNPSYLDPYVDHEYTPNLRAGNPQLAPQYTHSFELGYEYEQQGASYGLTAYYRRNRDSATEVTDYLGNGFSLTTRANLPRDASAGMEFLLSGHLLRQLGFSLSGNAFYTQIDATALGSAGLRATEGVNAKAKLDYRPAANDSLQLTFTRTDKRLTPQGSISAINAVNFGYKHTFSPAVALVATVSDLFNGQHYQRLVATPQFTQRYERSGGGRIAFVGLLYSWGGLPKDKQSNFEYAPKAD